MDWWGIGQNFIASICGSGIVVYLLQKTFEANLQKRLQIHSIKFSWYYVEKAKTMTELYAKIQEMKFCLAIWTNAVIDYKTKVSSEKDRQNILECVNKKHDVLRKIYEDTNLWYHQKKIYFVGNDKIKNEVDEILQKTKLFDKEFLDFYTKPDKYEKCTALASEIEECIDLLAPMLSKELKEMEEPGK